MMSESQKMEPNPWSKIPFEELESSSKPKKSEQRTSSYPGSNWKWLVFLDRLVKSSVTSETTILF
jgi:hypothetical protein